MPTTSRSSPAFVPLKVEGTSVLLGSRSGTVGSPPLPLEMPNASKVSAHADIATNTSSLHEERWLIVLGTYPSPRLDYRQTACPGRCDPAVPSTREL